MQTYHLLTYKYSVEAVRMGVGLVLVDAQACSRCFARLPVSPLPLRFWSMHALELRPSTVSFAAAISSTERAGQWQVALHLLSKMLGCC